MRSSHARFLIPEYTGLGGLSAGFVQDDRCGCAWSASSRPAIVAPGMDSATQIGWQYLMHSLGRVQLEAVHEHNECIPVHTLADDAGVGIIFCPRWLMTSAPLIHGRGKRPFHRAGCTRVVLSNRTTSRRRQTGNRCDHNAWKLPTLHCSTGVNLNPPLSRARLDCARLTVNG